MTGRPRCENPFLDLVHLEEGVSCWLTFYNHERRHQTLDYQTPWSVWQKLPELAA